MTNLAPTDRKGLTHEPIINWSNIPEKHHKNLEEGIVCGFCFYDKEAVVCGGIRKVSSQKYENGYPHSDSAPIEQQLRDEQNKVDDKRKNQP